MKKKLIVFIYLIIFFFFFFYFFFPLKYFKINKFLIIIINFIKPSIKKKKRN
jgi:hypothetical protein